MTFLNGHGYSVVLGDWGDGPSVALLEKGTPDEYGCLALEDEGRSKILRNYRWTYVNYVTGAIVVSDLNSDAPFEKVYDFLTQEDAPFLEHRRRSESGK